MDVDMTRHSEVLYKALCEIIGDEDVVKLHRIYKPTAFSVLGVAFSNSQSEKHMNWSNISKFFGGFDIQSLIPNYTEEFLRNVRILDSGSRTEGFNFPSSDFDMMLLLKDVKVIHIHTHENSTQSQVVLSVEKDNTRPGFVRLKALHITTQCAQLIVLSKLVQSDHGSSPHAPFPWSMVFEKLGQNDYLSSKLLIEMLSTYSKVDGINCDPHGPCLNLTLHTIDVDIAVALSSELWPTEAAGCVHRLLKRGWPPYEVVKDMVSDGCLFVPIGCKKSPHADIEWRISFSLAEKRLVHSMNHTQFLTYGLLKLFLKEVVEEHRAVKGLLCSYFMKTLVFWEILESKIPWTSSYLLQHAWNCFRRLLSWISNAYCPNFFIPENNMFLGKIKGRNRQRLTRFFSSHKRKGILMFTEIPSLRYGIDRRGAKQRITINNVLKRSLVIKSLYSETVIRTQGNELYDVLKSSQSNYLLEFKDFLRLNGLNLYCFKILCSEISKGHHNRTKYLKEKSLFRLIKLSSPNCVLGKIFMAVYFYNSKRYESCVSLLQKAIQKLKDPRKIYMWEFDPGKYSSLGGDDMSVSQGIYRFTCCNVPLDSATCIPEISDECNAPLCFLNFQFISPWVLSHFLLCLCNFWKGDQSQARVHLDGIRDCLQNRRHHISSDTYNLSWQILGIGQEILGDFQDALRSYGECRKDMTTWKTIFFNDLLEVNKQRSSRLTSLLGSTRRLSTKSTELEVRIHRPRRSQFGKFSSKKVKR